MIYILISLIILLTLLNTYQMKKLRLILIGATADVAAAIATLTTAVQNETVAVDQLVVFVQSLKDEIAAIQVATTDPTTVAQLQALQDSITAETTKATDASK